MHRAPAPPPYGTIVFDCDSTLCSIEGIEDLAGERAAEIHALTERAMRGEVPLESVYGMRLDMIRPSATDVEALGRRYVATLLPNVAELTAALRSLAKRVCIVSSGLLAPVRAVARAIGVEPRDVFAVDVRHDSSGAFLGFDASSPLARAGGKLAVVRTLAAGVGAQPPVALVGDGATDLEALACCARFVAFGGVEHRAPVFAAADVGCDVADFAALLPLLCSADELARLARDPVHAALVTAARALPH
ncbi:MAG: HAD family hydrolase [Planctomycetota bacterium]|nr:MAG: HAD family hydrolase [Planctomycetota bacterium]